MNANELADALKAMESGWFDDLTLKEAADLLRILDGQLAFRIDAVTKYQVKVEEQQAEIEMLEAELKAMREQLNANQV
jgi:HAMP domain-containing protein